ncbi:glycoside hydrolase family 18 protein [Corallococcus praedator]|uniref:chitinase n=1 Tax=Corallococcus praedator TaxID=2316724 RepID=A0ABX9QHW2_9BACT|nr:MULTISPECIES: glycoside hydrolase family 18 protein [Corallococcus]RKH26441.1 glycoside hydrolase family 18 protein [Corallococcus sp. CA031C]RKI06232.1 glycoside hydrolase family 18 protein [Corallococcus praedator]
MRRNPTALRAALLTTLLMAGVSLGAPPRPKVPGDAGTPPRPTTWIYQDQLVAPWQDLTWAGTHSLSATTPVAVGTRAISVTLGAWEALYFGHEGLRVEPGDTLVLRVHGGKTGGNAAVRVRVVIGTEQPVGVPLGPTCDGGTIPAGRWTSCRVPLSKLVPEGRTNITGLWLQEDSGGTLPPLFFDHLGVEHSGAPSLKAGVSVTLNTPDVFLSPGATHAFVATVANSPNTEVAWSVDPGRDGGALSATGLYTAPKKPGVYRVMARSKADPQQQAVATVVVSPPTPPGQGKWVSGYYTGWNADDYPPEKVDFSALTHILVGRVTPKPDGTLSTKFDNDRGPEIARILSKRAHAAGRKAIIMVGGSGEHDGWVGAASDANRAKFVRELLKAMDDFGYDGLDLDWEPVKPEDRPQLLALAKALREARPKMLLTFPLHWINTNFPNDADPWFVQLAAYFDQLNLMSYEMIGAWDGWKSWHTSALRGEQGLHPTSIASSLELWVKAGIPKAKLGLGIPFYGLAWRHITGPYQPFTNWSDYVGGDNSFTYKKILRYSKQGKYQWDEKAQASYVTFAPDQLVEDGTVTWISYDSPQAIAAKGAFVKQEGYGGAIIWTLNQGCIDPATGANPLLDAVKGAFLK